MVDGISIGAYTGGMRLRFLTDATDPSEKSEFSLMASSGGEAGVVLAEGSYFQNIEKELKIRKYAKQRNMSQLPEQIRNIIHMQLS